jgi:hypothetical protein
VTYVGWYFGLGFIVIALLFVVARRDRQDPESLPPLWVWIFFIAVWPVLLYGFTKTRLAAKSEPTTTSGEDSLSWLEEQAHECTLTPEDLRERLTVGEIETREMIIDPLSAVPDLPFGHLNVVWRRFLDDHVESDELWSFSTLGESGELRKGYAKVRDGKPISHFVANRKLLERK